MQMLPPLISIPIEVFPFFDVKHEMTSDDEMDVIADYITTTQCDPKVREVIKPHLQSIMFLICEIFMLGRFSKIFYK
jgi:hypothetical protein